MSKTQPLGSVRGKTVPASTNSQNIDWTAASYYADRKANLVVYITSTHGGTLYMTFGDETDTDLAALPHVITEAVTANETLGFVCPFPAGCNQGRVYFANASGGPATYNMHAGLEEV